MKVVHLSKYYKPYFGGLESVVSDIAEGQAKLGAEVTVLACDVQHLKAQENIEGVNVIRSREQLSLASTPISLNYIKNTFRNIKNSIVHIHLPNPLANLALVLSLFIGTKPKKIIVHWHSDIVKQKKLLLLYSPLVNLLLKRADNIIVTSQRYLDSSEQLINFKNKCVVIPIGTKPLEVVDIDKVNTLKSIYNKRIIFSLGRHIYYKGFECLIEAIAKLERDDVIFLIGGAGPDTDKYRNLIIKNKLQSKVEFIGRVPEDEIPLYFNAADIFCFPSIEKSEAFGVVQLEAMSVGTPVISTDIAGSGVPWVNKHLESGIVCTPNNPEELTSAINKALDNDELLIQLSKGALLRFNQHFTVNKMVESINRIYRNIS